MTAESATHKTFWHLEKREGSVEDFIACNRPEAVHVLNGHRAIGQGVDRVKLHEEMDRIGLWLNDPATGVDVRELWTPDRMVDAALHNLFISGVDPFEVLEREGNILVTAGITTLLNLLKGTADTAFSNGNSYLGVGDSSTSTNVAQTDLQAASNKLRKAMNATYPQATAPTISWQATFGSSEANFVWNEVGTFNGPSGGTMLNRVVQALGTKSAGSSWSLTETITWS